MDSHVNRTQAVLLAVVLVIGSFLLGLYMGAEQPAESSQVTDVTNKTPPEEINREISQSDGTDFETFWKAWNMLRKNHIDSGEIDTQTKIWSAIQGLARAYDDPYTVFLPPKEAKDFQDEINGEFEGVGMEVSMEDEALTVVAPLKDTPADRAGIQPGDVIARIDDESTLGMTLDEAVDRIRGPKGSEVMLTIIREDRSEAFEVSVTRGTIQIPTIDTELRDGAFVISLYSFSANATDLFGEALKKFKQSGEDDLVIDLRGNPGGFLEASVEIASHFLPSGEVVVREVGPGEEERSTHRSYGYNTVDMNEVDVAVLVNRGSASASEILAGALSQAGDATLVGSQTFGKGSVQELSSLTSETSLKITVAEWLTPNGTSISEDGLTPEIEIVDEDREDDIDEELNRAIEIVTEN